MLEIALVGRKFLGAWFSLTCMTSLFLLFLVLANVGGMQVLLISNMLIMSPLVRVYFVLIFIQYKSSYVLQFIDTDGWI